MEWLKRQEPQTAWDGAGHAPPLKTAGEWIKAGEIVFESPTGIDVPPAVPVFASAVKVSGPYDPDYGAAVTEVRDPAWYQKVGTPIAKDGIMPFYRYFIRKKGTVELGTFSCATCHTRVMPDGSILKGAQGNFPVEVSNIYDFRASVGTSKEPAQALNDLRANERFLFKVPWLRPDPLGDLDRMSWDDIATRHEAMPPGVMARHGTSLFYPVQTPDLIGAKDRRYFDHTGLQQHRGPVDLMRYAALNQGADALSSFDGFVPVDFANFNRLPNPSDPVTVGGRYSDEQLYALALYLYSLQPPPNPNKFDAQAARGQKIFKREGCQTCHTPPLYTNNKLTPAEGFTPPPGAEKKYDILPVSVGTDPNLALKTRRGTGYYKVPSLKGVWYRSMFGHSGWCATLEDWFDPRRTRDNYVPTGFKPYGAQTYAVKGHPFGLDLSQADRAALIAFLKTL
jgi:hypothetical protein